MATGYWPRVFIFATLIASCLGSFAFSAAAEELLPNPDDRRSSFDSRWTGIYIGGHIGVHDIDTIGIFDAFEPGGGIPDLSNLGDSGAHRGVQAGVNFQWHHIFLGVEADASWGGFNQSYTTIQDGSASEAFLLSYPIVGNLDYLATIRGRMGFDTSGLSGFESLLYLTAGVAFTTFEMDIADGRSMVEFDAMGIVFGGGVEWALSDQWSLRAEYLHYDFDERLDIASVAISGIFDANAGNFVTLDNIDIFRIALNYRFY